MSKDDVEVPDEIPKKRRQLEVALDKWIAVWLARDDLTPSERRRLEEERFRRKETPVGHPVGLLVGPEGATPEQVAAVPELLVGVTDIYFPVLPTKLYRMVRDHPDAELHIYRHWDAQEAQRIVVRALPRESARVIGIVRSASPEGTGVWEMIRLAKHRGMPAQVVLPNGQLHEGDT